MFLYIVRHGQPVYAPQEMLTETGHRQAHALVDRLKIVGITKIFSSPLRRARETAQPTAECLGLPVSIEPWMSEDLQWYRFKSFLPNGEESTKWMWDTDDPAALVRGANHDAGERWAEIDPFAFSTTAKAGYDELAASSDEFMARHGYERDGNEYIIREPNDEKIAVFCHQGFALTWLSHLLRIPPNIFWAEFDITHTGVTVLELKSYECGRTIPKCLCLSDVSHLFAADDCNLLYHGEMPF